MASNVLTGKIQVTAPGVAATFQQVSNSATKTESQLKKLSPASNQATLALSNLSRVAQDAPYGFIGIANNLNPLLESFQRLKTSTGSTGGALKALGKSMTGAGGIGLALGIVSSLAVVFGDKLFGVSRAAEKAKTKADELSESIKSIFKETAKEAAQAGAFVTILKSETETRERKLSAIKELQKIQPEIFKGLRLEGEAVIGIDIAYKNYLDNLRNVIAAKIIQAKLEQKIEELLNAQGATLSKSEREYRDFADSIKKFRLSQVPEDQKIAFGEFLDMSGKGKAKALSIIEKDIQDLFNSLSEFSSSIKVPDLKTSGLKIKPDKIDIDLSGADIEVPGTNLIFIKKKLIDAFALTQIQIPKIFMGAKGPVTKDDGFGVIADQIKNQELQLRGLADTISGVLTPAFQGFFDTVKGGGNAFKAFANAAGQALIALIEKLAIAAILSLVLSSITGAGTAIGAASGKFSDIFKFLSGFGGARASGGPVSAGKSYLVGEDGAEIFRPNTGGYIVPNNQLGGGATIAGGISVSGVVTNILRGKDLVQLIALQTQSNNRLI